jgi:hypothetical protein
MISPCQQLNTMRKYRHFIHGLTSNPWHVKETNYRRQTYAIARPAIVA